MANPNIPDVAIAKEKAPLAQSQDLDVLMKIIASRGWFGSILTHPQLSATAALRVSNGRHDATKYLKSTSAIPEIPTPDRQRGTA